MSAWVPFSNVSVPLFRSEDMSYVSITVTNDAAYETLMEIGKFGRFHFVDLTAGVKDAAPSKQHLVYKKRLQDCLYWEKKFASFREEMKRRDVMIPADDTPKQEIKAADLMDDLAAFLDPIEHELVLSAGFQKDNQRQMSELIERSHVLRVCQDVKVSEVADHLAAEVDAAHRGDAAIMMNRGLLDSSEEYKRPADDRLRNFIAGVLPVESVEQMRRMLYRISRGNALARFQDIDTPIIDPASGESMKKSVFWIVFLGEQLNTRITKMCEIIHATIYAMPANRDETQRVLDLIDQELSDKQAVDKRTEDSIYNLLSRLAYDHDTSPLMDWEFAVHKEKMICNIFMKCHFYLTMIAVEGWIPSDEVNTFKDVCRDAVMGTGHPPAAVEVNPANPLRPPEGPPTYFKLNKFTATFQGIVDTYGIPRYKEVNPGLFTVITFPFLFGVMYGDIGHGVLLTLFASYLVWNEAKLDKQRRAGKMGEIPQMAFGGRYVMLLMGLFAIYCGMIYNDVMSIPTHLYPSNWGSYNDAPQLFTNTTVWDQNNTLYPIHDYIYPIGVDPNWYHKQNTLAFFNSMKMKMAVILGVVQMLFGLVLLYCNHSFFQDRLGVWFEFVPRMIFLLCTFGYMDFMIIYKWSVNWVFLDGTPAPEAPNLIQTMINMFLSPGVVDDGKQLYDQTAQKAVQAVLLLGAVFSIPFMLCGKPCVHRHRAKKAAMLTRGGSDDDVHQYHDLVSPGGTSSSASEIRETENFAPGDSEASYHAGGLNVGGGIASDEYTEEKRDGSRLGKGVGNGGAATPTHATATDGHGHGGGAYSFSDEMIHNSIHTIEFVLGCVSNTASYLRLWALSLAHAQLAEVFWDKMIMQYGVVAANPVFSFIGFAVWTAATFAVLLCMDVLECFLHALRLHWVEFQNKFFYADGRPFEPFAFVPTEY